MKERPILFSGDMVRAILDGRKTQTRRVIKPQPYSVSPVTNTPFWEEGSLNCPYQIGDRLWVRETWALNPYLLELPAYVYRADYEPLSDILIKWKPSIHMPRSASRITLEITGVRVERLQDISEQDAIAEGIESAQLPNEETCKLRWKDYQAKFIKCGFFSSIDSFKSLWDSINVQKHPWESNPWVWVVEFKILK